jgi:hypothetical protein
MIAHFNGNEKKENKENSAKKKRTEIFVQSTLSPRKKSMILSR